MIALQSMLQCLSKKLLIVPFFCYSILRAKLRCHATPNQALEDRKNLKNSALFITVKLTYFVLLKRLKFLLFVSELTEQSVKFEPSAYNYRE